MKRQNRAKSEWFSQIEKEMKQLVLKYAINLKAVFTRINVKNTTLISVFHGFKARLDVSIKNSLPANILKCEDCFSCLHKGTHHDTEKTIK